MKKIDSYFTEIFVPEASIKSTLVPNILQAITRTIDNPVRWGKYASPGFKELMEYLLMMWRGELIRQCRINHYRTI